MTYRFFPHTADIGIDLAAPSLEELYEEAAAAFTDALSVREAIGETTARPLSLHGESHGALLVELLEELLFLFEVEGLLVHRLAAKVEGEAPELALTAAARGEVYDPDRHPIRVLIKGVTWHQLVVERGPEGWVGRVILDI